MEVVTRPEAVEDISAIYRINAASFETPAEARIVDKLRKTGDHIISLVAEMDEEVLGHILFTEMILEPGAENFRALGLAPMAVLPEYQNKGIGSKLVKAGLEECKRIEVPAVFVLGHPEFYPRFGFIPAENFKIKSEYPDLPPGVFMAQELEEGSLKHLAGTARYHPVFNEAM
jgi:putative acetyltransferase